MSDNLPAPTRQECIIYNFDLLEPVRVREILKAKGHDDEKTEEIILRLISSAEKKTIPIKMAPKPKVVTESNSSLTPCQDCGGTIFLRTGTCHVCQTCGVSQGCS